jgi:hypothetical protein
MRPAASRAACSLSQSHGNALAVDGLQPVTGYKPRGLTGSRDHVLVQAPSRRVSLARIYIHKDDVCVHSCSPRLSWIITPVRRACDRVRHAGGAKCSRNQ